MERLTELAPEYSWAAIGDIEKEQRGSIAVRAVKSVKWHIFTVCEMCIRDRCDIPMMFIHGDADDFVPFEMLDKVYESASCEKQKLVIEGAGHAMSSSVAPELYWSEVEKFLDRHMNLSLIHI